MAFARDGRATPLAAIIPLILSLAGFVLAMLALFAGTGSQQQALEDYHFIAINMSNFGHNLVPTATSSGSQPTATGDSLWDQIEDGLEDIGSDITDELNDIENDIADQLARDLGISQWYSLHIMTACEGNFAPNATSPGAWYNTTNCTAQSPGVHFNLTDIIQREIDEGPLHINASDIPIPDSIQETINYVNSFLLAAFILYVLGAGFAGLSFLSCIVVLTVSRGGIGRGLILFNIVLTALATIALAVGSAIATAISKRGVSEINSRGQEAGISAIEGTKFMIISWVSFAVMFVALLCWSVMCCYPRRRSRSTTYVDKGPRTSTDSNRGLLGMFRRRH
ncbi:hypothetical protein GGR54DRAFT_620410 [Hypoxylon sp. NC1633]|nr:hypothetical protein GGR54DRAFT_620410 [Hypoxylon sp. NC1633]